MGSTYSEGERRREGRDTTTLKPALDLTFPQVLQKLLKFWYQNDDKVLIFSYSIPLLRILNSLFKTTEYNVSYLDGSMSLEDRGFPPRLKRNIYS